MSIIGLLILLLNLYSYVLLARALVSWIPNLDPYHPAVQVLYQLTEPVLDPIRKLIPPLGGFVDISIIIAFVALIFLEQILRTL